MADKNTGNPFGNVLSEDEKQINEFVQARLKKVLGDLEELTRTGSEDQIAWSSCFSYLTRTYGVQSDEPFKWYKYYLRKGQIPADIQLPILMQIYQDGTVDAGFVNVMARVFKNEPAENKERRRRMMDKELQKYFDKDGKLCLYRGEFHKPFGDKDDESRPIEKAFAFSVDETSALHYATCWYPESAKLYTVQVPAEDVLSYNLYQEDKPVFILPVSKGGQMKVINVRDVDASEYPSEERKSGSRAAYHANFESANRG